MPRPMFRIHVNDVTISENKFFPLCVQRIESMNVLKLPEQLLLLCTMMPEPQMHLTLAKESLIFTIVCKERDP